MRIEYTAAFLRQLRRLGRRYRHIRKDIEPVINELRAGKVLGDQIQHTGLTLFKVRVRNTDVQKGKSAGYRLIYYLKTPERIILVTIYSKSDQGDIDKAALLRILEETGASS
jgi:mRNA-degrading endonuclease RelE of RelBE toxin-antitoxin system